MYRTPQGPLDRIFCAAVQGQRRPIIGPVLRQLLKARGTDIPPATLAPGTDLVVRHIGHVVVHVKTRIGHAVVTSGRGVLTVGEGTVVGANSVLTVSTGKWEIWAGAPARKVGERERPSS